MPLRPWPRGRRRRYGVKDRLTSHFEVYSRSQMYRVKCIMAVVRLSGTSCLLATTDHLVNLVFGGLLWTPLLGNSDLSLVVGAMCRETPGHEEKSPDS